MSLPARSTAPAELLAQVEKITSSTRDPSFTAEGEPTTVTTASGQTGVMQSYSSVDGDGLVAAFVIDGTGVEIVAYGPSTQLTAARASVEEMIASITALETEESAA